MGSCSMPKDIKFFRSKYWEGVHNLCWKPIENTLIEKGYQVHQQIEPCDTAFILCGLMENPNAFDNKVLFYNSQPFDGLHPQNLALATGIIQTLKEYYDESYDMRGLHPEVATEAILEVYDTHKS